MIQTQPHNLLYLYYVLRFRALSLLFFTGACLYCVSVMSVVCSEVNKKATGFCYSWVCAQKKNCQNVNRSM